MSENLLADLPFEGYRDFRLIRRALLQGWEIPQSTYSTLASKVSEIFETTPSPRIKIQAAKTLCLMASHNLRVADRLSDPDEPSGNIEEFGTIDVNPDEVEQFRTIIAIGARAELQRRAHEDASEKPL